MELDPETIPITTTSSEDLLLKLERLFNEKKIYREQDLKITDIARLLNSNRTYISNLINNQFKYSFSEYVNRHRINEAKSIITQAPSETLEQIAIRVGYGSSSTFFRAFRAIEGITPSNFKQRIIKQQKAARFS